MIRSFFGITHDPFSSDTISLLPFQQDIYDVLLVHAQQGGLCLVMGDPGTGKSTVKDTVRQNADKRAVIACVGRTLHTYTHTVKIICQAFNIEFDGDSFKCEKRLIEESYALNRQGKTLMTIIDDAHLMDIDTLRRLRLLFGEFPKNHNLILFGHIDLLVNMSLKVHEDIKSRVTYSVTTQKLSPDDAASFILTHMDKAGLGHNTFTDEAIALIARSTDGVLRKLRNLTMAALIEAVRLGKKQIDIGIVNRVLIQPHWRVHNDVQAHLP